MVRRKRCWSNALACSMPSICGNRRSWRSRRCRATMTIASAQLIFCVKRQWLTQIERRSDRLAELERRAADLEADLACRAQARTATRRAGAAELAGAVASELEDLRLAGARFAIGIEPAKLDTSGADRIEF